MRKLNSNILPWILIALIIIGAGLFIGIKLRNNKPAYRQNAEQKKDPYLAFSNEIYDTIQENYWNKINDDSLTEMYRLAAAKINTSTPATLASKDKTGLNGLISDEIKNLSEDKKKGICFHTGQYCLKQPTALWPQRAIYPAKPTGAQQRT